MNQIWIVVVVLLALLVFMRMRNRRQGKQRTVPKPGMRINGFRVSAYVHPRMGSACLLDDGMQFGKGFRRKEGPAIPHDEECGCEVSPFTFSSSEVFNGALRKMDDNRCSIPGLPGAGALIEGLKTAETGPLPADEAGYRATVDTSAIPGEFQEAVAEFLSRRYAYLKEKIQSGEAARLTEEANPKGMESAEST